MDWLRLIDVDRFVVFTLVLTRVSGLIMTAPIFGTKEAPMMVRGLLSMTLALLIMPTQWNVATGDPGTTPQYLVIVGSELLIGVCLGMGIMVFLSGIQMAGELMSRIGGLNMSDVFDPTFNADVPLFSRVLVLVSTAVFMVIGGHRIVMAGLLDTFQSIPPGSGVDMLLGASQSSGVGNASFAQSLLETFVVLTTESFNLGIRASVPVLTAILLATFVLGLIGRTMPQFNVLALGFGLNSMITFGVLALSFGAIIGVFQEQIEPTLQILLETLRIPTRPI